MKRRESSLYRWLCGTLPTQDCQSSQKASDMKGIFCSQREIDMDKVTELMNEIKHLDTEVGNQVFLQAAGHSSGFAAYVSFRSWGQDIGRIETHGDTAVEALEKLKNGLLEKFMSRDFYMDKANLMEPIRED